MNITGYGQYSKQVAGLKDPQKIINQQHKLIFIYPMLYADKIRVPNLENLLRDFLSVTFLTDIFIQNFFNTVSIANQIRPLWDERRQAIDPASVLARIDKQLPDTGDQVYVSKPSLPNYPVPSEATPVIQQKLTQKTAIIQHLMKADPRFSKLRPFIEIITLGNMIDVPVIVGTTLYPVDTLTLFYALIAAIGLKRKLNNRQDVEFIFNELKTLDETKYWRLLDNLLPDAREQMSFLSAMREKTVVGAYTLARKMSPYSSVAGNVASYLRKRIENPPSLGREHPKLTPLLLKKQDLDQTKLYFDFVLDPAFAKKKFGIDTSTEKERLGDLSLMKFQKKLQEIEKTTVSEFSYVASTIGNVLLRSIVNIVSVAPSSLSFSELKNQYLDQELSQSVSDDLIEILIAIDNSLKGSSSGESKQKMEILKSLCKINSSEVLSEFENMVADSHIESYDFSYDDYKKFIKTFDEIVSGSVSLSTKIETELKYFVSAQESGVLVDRLKILKSDIIDKLNTFFREYQKEIRNSTPANYPRVTVVAGVQPNAVVNGMIPKLVSGVANIFYFILLSGLQASLCKFVLTAEVDIETTSDEVTSWPNYALVLPVEIVMALHAATMGASWKQMLYDKPVRADRQQIVKGNILTPNENYIKAIVKFISNRLEVPNLIVVDSKRSEIYYKFMNQDSINKIKLSTIDTFIQSKLNRQMISNY